MTVASETNRSGPYTGNGVTTTFNYGFRILDEAHISVILTEGGVDAVLVLATDYTVSGVGDAGGGQIDVTSAPTASQTITILRDVPFTQETDLENQGPYFAETIEASLDLATMRDQQLSELASRAVRVPASNPTYNPDQLVNDILAVSSNRALAEAARVGAEAAASALGNQVRQYDTEAQAVAANIPAGVNLVRLLGRAAAGDLGVTGALYKRSPVNPAHTAKIQSADGAWFEIASAGQWAANLIHFGADASGVVAADDAFDAAILLGASVILLPPGSFRFTRRHTITAPLAIIGAGPEATTVIPAIGLGANAGDGICVLFATNTSNFCAEGFTISGTGLTMSPATVNHYAFISALAGASYKNHIYRNLRFKDWRFTDGLTGLNNLLVSHCIYAQKVTGVLIEDCEAGDVSGAFAFVQLANSVAIRRNRLRNVVWYNVNLYTACAGCFILENTFEFDGTGATGTGGIWWGGAVNSMSQTGIAGGGPNTDIVVMGNRFSGYYSYGAVIRIESTIRCHVRYNTIVSWQTGSWALAADQSAIGVVTRGIGTGADQNGPCRDIWIEDNTIYSPTSALAIHRGIYCTNDWQTARNVFDGLHINRNHILSLDSTHGFANAIAVHGGPLGGGATGGGFENVQVEDNFCTTVTQAGAVGPGAISFQSGNATSAVLNVFVGGNSIKDLGAPAGSQNTAIGIGAYTDFVLFTKPNRIDNYWIGVYFLANSGVNVGNQYANMMSNMAAGGLFYLAAGGADKIDMLVPRSTTAELGNGGSDINNKMGKHSGMKVYNITTGGIVVADGAANTSDWRSAGDGTVVANP